MAAWNSLIKHTSSLQIVQETSIGHNPTINSKVINVPCDNQIISKMNEMRKHNQLCDIKLTTGKGHEIWAHKIVLAARSKYFNIIFTCGFKENTENEVFMQEINPYVLPLLVDYMYTCEIVINVENAVEILKGIRFLQLDESVLDVCINFIKTEIDHSNCLGLMELSECLSLNDFRSFCWKYILIHYKAITVTEEFLMISFDRVLEIIKSEDLCVEEEIVYNSVMKWIKHDTENRKKHMSDLFEFVRLPLVSPLFLQISVDTDELVKSNQDCKKYITEAYIVQLFNGTGFGETNSIRSQYRPKYSKYVLIMSQSGKRHYPILYDVVSHEWKTIPISVPKVLGGMILILNDGRIIEFGGFELYEGVRSTADGYEIIWGLPTFYRDNMLINVAEMNVNSATVFDFKEKRWTNIDQMIYCHSNSACVQVENRVYVISPNWGVNEYYNITTNKWIKISPMTMNRYHFNIIALDNFIYVVGGRTLQTTVSSVEQYNTKNNTWKTVAPMLHERFWPTLCVFENEIYAIGGCTLPHTYLNTVEKYDPIKNVWTDVAPLNISRTKAGAVSFNGVIYVFGGANSNFSIERYCPYQNTWTVMSDKIPNTLGLNCMCQAFVIPQPLQNLYLDLAK